MPGPHDNRRPGNNRNMNHNMGFNRGPGGGPRRGRMNNRRTNPFGIVVLIMFVAALIPSLIDFLLGAAVNIFGLLLALISVAVPVAAIVGIIYVLVKLINNSTKNNKQSQSSANVTSKQLLASLNEYFASNERLVIDDETYIIRTSDTNGLSSYDIYMNDEYISNLLVFANAYPSGFNRLSVEANTIMNPPKVKMSRKQKKKMQEELEKQAAEAAAAKKAAEEAAAAAEAEKGSAYYIKEFKRLNDNIPNPQITSDLNQLLEYLNAINKIETEFPECKDKTVKLYQYYLPMLRDILVNYHRLAENAGNQEELKENEDRLSKTIILINGALQTISSSLLEEYYTDLKVDMKTLEAVLKKDGYVDQFSNSTSSNM